MLYRAIGQDLAATGLNDVITLGLVPVSLALHVAVDDPSWLADRGLGLAEGFRDAANMAACVWGPGETSQLKGVIEKGTAELSCSVIGRSLGLGIWNAGRVEPGDAIIFCQSTGLHANGFSKIRSLESQHPNLYAWPMEGRHGFTLGRQLLQATPIYSPLVELCMRTKREAHYGVNITGHGWRKLMRPQQSLTYRIHTLPETLPIFRLLQRLLGYDDLTMYSTYNMGAGFALFVHPEHLGPLLADVADAHLPFRVFAAGRVEAGPKQVIIDPLGITLPGDSMHIR